MVVHESDLPRGRGFAPVAWQVLGGAKKIPICLIEASENVDAGDIFLREEISLTGYELNDEIRRLQGDATVDLCMQFLRRYPSFNPSRQEGTPTKFERRTPEDSRLDPNKSLREQFDLLRTVDNDRYPAFFEIDGRRYTIKISSNSKAQ